MISIRGKWNGNSYDILKKVGKGGFGVVYKAKDINGRIIVLKISKDTSSITREYYTMKELKGLDFVPEVYDCDDCMIGDEVYHFIAMDYIEGYNLKELLKKDLPIKELFKLGYLLVNKLEKLYNLGYKYTDVKLENIIAQNKGIVYFIDFGATVGKNSPTVEYTPFYNMLSWRKALNSNYDENIVFSTTMILVNLILKKEFSPILYSLEDVIIRINNKNINKNIKVFLDKGLRGKYKSLKEYKKDLLKLSCSLGKEKEKRSKIDYFFTLSLIFFMFSLFVVIKVLLF